MDDFIIEIIGEALEYGLEAVAYVTKKKREAKMLAQEDPENSEERNKKKYHMSLSTRLMRRGAIKQANHKK